MGKTQNTTLLLTPELRKNIRILGGLKGCVNQTEVIEWLVDKELSKLGIELDSIKKKLE
jgi:hypothetical protein